MILYLMTNWDHPWPEEVDNDEGADTWTGMDLWPIFYSSSGTETLKPAEHRKSNDKRCKSVVPR